MELKWLFMLRSFKPSLLFGASRVALVARIPLEFYAAIPLEAFAVQECFIKQSLREIFSDYESQSCLLPRDWHC